MLYVLQRGVPRINKRVQKMPIYSYLTETFFIITALIFGTIQNSEETWTEDVKLVKRLKAGDRRAFAELVKKYQESIYTTCYCMVWNQEDAEDAAREAFVTSFEKIRNLRDGKKYYLWVKTIAENSCKKLMKKRKREGSELPENGSADVTSTHGSKPVSVDRLVEQQDTINAVRNAIDGLNEEDRAIVELKHFCELKFDEVARRLDIPVNTAKTRFYRALEKLAQKLEYLKE
jgi:RNA polymerase sigma-70 factor (ECF subfamily)